MHSGICRSMSAQHDYSLLSLGLENKKFVVAHRGASGIAPENTLSSLQLAISAGATMVEIDVQITRDDQVIMLHDPYLGRTTSGKGKVRLKSYDELSDLDAGSWFHESFASEKIPLLKEGLQLLKDHQVFVNIEIKPPQEQDDFKERVHNIIDIVQSLNMLNVTLFSSFHHESLLYMKKEIPGTFTAAINVPGDNRLPSEIAGEIGCDAFVCSLKELNHKRDDDTKKNNILLGIYTINTIEDFTKVMKYHAPALVTNFPDRIQHFLHEHH